MRLLPLALAVGLTGCGAVGSPTAETTAQIDAVLVKGVKVNAAIAAGCAEVAPLLPLAELIPYIGSTVVAGVKVACNTEAGLAKLAADPSSAVWLGKQLQILKTVLHHT